MIRVLSTPATERSISRRPKGRGREVRGSTKVPHNILRDKHLSDEARGLLVYMLSKPQTWIFTIGKMARHKHVGEQRLRRVLAEIEDIGYLERVPVRKEGRNAGFQVRWHFNIGGYFALIPNRFINQVSLKALGVFGVIAAAPPNWIWYGSRLMRATRLGAHALRGAIKELEAEGMIIRTRVRKGNRLDGWHIEAVGVPKPLPSDFQQADFQQAENTQAENSGRVASQTAKTRAPKQEGKTSKKKKTRKKEDATLSTGRQQPTGDPPEGTVSKTAPAPKRKTIASKTPKPKRQTPSPAFAVLDRLPDKHRRRWMGIARNKVSRGAAHGLAQKWPELIGPLMNLSFAARLTAHTTAIWTQDTYRAAKEHGPEKVLKALERATRSRDPLTTFRRALDEEPFEPLDVPAPIDQNLWKILALHLEEMNGPLTRPQVELLFNRLKTWIEKHGLAATENAVRTAIQRKWRNVYEPKPKQERRGRSQPQKKPSAVPTLKEEHEVFGHRDPWSYQWPKKLLEVVGQPPDPKDIEACREWYWDVGEKALYAEHFDIPKQEAERVCREWGFRL